MLQAVGGGSSSASDSLTILKVGGDVMIAGLAFQVFTLLVFGLLAGDYFFRVRRGPYQRSPTVARKFMIFCIMATIAYVCIFVRCCYRVAELSGGWGNPIMRKEPEFIVLDSLYVSALLLYFRHICIGSLTTY